MDSSRTPANSDALTDWHQGILDVIPVPLSVPKNQRFITAGTTDQVFRLKLSETEDEAAIKASILTQPGVKSVQPNHIFRTATSNDPRLSDEWYYSQLKMDAALEMCSGNASVVIAVVDTGINFLHEDLVGHIWENPNEIANDGRDNDNNGYIDDIRGWDFVSVSQISASAVGKIDDYAPQDNNPSDVQGHGTFVAGILGMVGNNGKGGRGVAGNCKIMPVRAGFADENGDGAFTSTDLAQGIAYATSNGAKIINLSLGGFGIDPVLRLAVRGATDAGVIVVAAVGNSRSDTDAGLPFIPATYSGVIGVSGTNIGGQFDWNYSNFGASVDISAPGTDIFSTESSATSAYGYESGTSMASPIVSGIAGLILSLNPSANVASILANSAKDGGSLGRDDFYGAGVIDPVRALQLADSSTPDIRHVLPNSANIGYPVTLSATINDDTTPVAELTVVLYYRFANSGEWLSATAKYSDGKFYASTEAPQHPKALIQYYWRAGDYNPANTVDLPENEPNTAFELLLTDTRGPDIAFSKISNDYVDINSPLPITFSDATSVNYHSVTIQVADDSKTVTYSSTSPEVTLTTGGLTLSLKEGLFSSAVTVSVTIKDSQDNSATRQLKLRPAGAGALTSFKGISGLDATQRVLAYPNPYSPSQGTVQFAFYLDRDSEMTTRIYSRNLENVRVLSDSKAVGYATITWDGKDEQGKTVPAGVYFVILTAKSDGGTVTKRLKVAVKN